MMLRGVSTCGVKSPSVVKSIASSYRSATAFPRHFGKQLSSAPTSLGTSNTRKETERDTTSTSTKAYAMEAETADSFKELDYDPALANQVSLVGNTGKDMDVRTTPNGRSVCNGTLAVKRKEKGAAVTDWYNLEMWGQLAEEAADKVGQGSRVLVQGSLKQRSYMDSKSGVEKKSVTVLVRNINFINRPPEGMQPAEQQYDEGDAPSRQEYQPTQAATSAGGATAKKSFMEMWEELRVDPDKYYDNRIGKLNPRAPDFKRKATGEGIWLDNASTPEWAKEKYPVGGSAVPNF